MPNCKQCSTGFEITDEDRKFYEMMEVPEPTFCYLCRMQRRLSFRSERFLYHRKCNFTGQEMISTYSSDKPFPVYHNDVWWGDEWDPLSYGQDFDFNRPFFEQFFKFRNQVPRLALIQQKPMENSEYCNAASRNKNCYLVFSTNHCEDCYYGSWVNYSRNCVDNLNSLHNELSYECVGCSNCYNLRYSQDCNNCKNSFFLRNCVGCRECFGCWNLVNKQYYVFNKPYTKEQYEQFLSEVDTGSHTVIEKIKAKFAELTKNIVVKEFFGTNNINSFGDYLNECKNCHLCFECHNCEDLRYCQCIENSKLGMDWSHWGQESEKMYECQACGYNNYNLRFCNLCWMGSTDLTYCDHCFSAKNCFGSVGLKKHQYCIFNKQYNPEKYEDLKNRIIEHMKKTGEWGEFFATSHSIYAYNETLAHEQITLTKEEILAKGWKYKEKEETLHKGETYEIPDNIKDVDEEIVGKVLSSEKSGDPYKIIPQEFKFYKENKIPIPHLTPDERHWKRLEKRNHRVLHDRRCAKCQKDIKTFYPSSRSEKVYCEECYLKEVY